MKVSECRELVNEELIKSRDEALLESMKLRFELARGVLASPAKIKSLRRNVARIETVLNERRLEAEEKSEGSNG
ncbi:MAG: 50S ribosomal protein L29 [Nitrospinota bacterium]|nr:50S ribosomal protein L29 [Nitrospinota bacterium]